VEDEAERSPRSGYGCGCGPGQCGEYERAVEEETTMINSFQLFSCNTHTKG